MNVSHPGLLDLIALGKAGRARVPKSLRSDKDWEAFNAGSDSWVALAAALTPEEVEQLIRGLILHAKASGRPHQGLISPVVWLFGILRLDFPEREARLGAWIVANRTNPRDPFDVADDGGAHTWAEYRANEKARLRERLTQAARQRKPTVTRHITRERRAAAPVGS